MDDEYLQTPEKTPHSTQVLTHWFLNNTVIVWCIIGIHWFKKRPGHLMGLPQEKKTKHHYCQVEIPIPFNFPIGATASNNL